MNTFASIIGLDDVLHTPMVRYYTVALEVNGETTNLLGDFILNHRSDEQIREEFNDLLAWLQVRMGSMHGAQKRFFRHEGAADGLPPPARFLEFEHEHHLRLYCMRLSDHVVILFNGGVKTATTAQECPVVAPHFHRAQKLCNAIQQAIRDHEIELIDDETRLSIPEGFEIMM